MTSARTWCCALMALFLSLPVRSGGAATAIPGSYTDQDCFRHRTSQSCIVQPLFTSHRVLIVQFAGNHLALTPFSYSLHYSWKWTDFAPATSWIGRGAGFLARDLNHDHCIEREELFGSMTQTGPALLSRLDSNGDGALDSKDTAFSTLLIWTDSNRDGRCQAGEVHTLAETGIESIDIHFVPAKRAAVDNNGVGSTAPLKLVDGKRGLIADVTFPVNWTFTNYLGAHRISQEARKLPDLHGYGRLTSLRVAMSRNRDLLATGLRLQSMKLDDLKGYAAAVEDVLFRWANVNTIAPASRGPYFDARKLAFLEAYTGEYYASPAGGPDPLSASDAAVLGGVWSDLLSGLTDRLLVQDRRSPMSAVFRLDLSDDAITPRSGFADVVQDISAHAPSPPDAATAYWMRALSILSGAVADYAPQADRIHPMVRRNLKAASPRGFSAEILAEAGNGKTTYVNVSAANAATAGGRVVYGGKDGEIFDVTVPDMTIVGGGGSDWVIVGAGSGDINIVEQQSVSDRRSTLYFRPDISPQDLVVKKGLDGDLVLSGKGTRIKLVGMLGDRMSGIDSIVFEDGTRWSRRRLNMMARQAESQ